MIGKGKTSTKALKDIKMVVEGVSTTKAAKKLAKKHKIQLPVTDQVYSVLFRNKDPLKAEKDLMTRSLKSEY